MPTRTGEYSHSSGCPNQYDVLALRPASFSHILFLAQEREAFAAAELCRGAALSAPVARAFAEVASPGLAELRKQKGLQGVLGHQYFVWCFVLGVPEERVTGHRYVFCVFVCVFDLRSA